MKRYYLTAIVCLLTVSAFATTIIPMTVEELTANASRIIEGKAVATWSAWDADHRIILTYTRFSVTKSLKGGSVNEVVVQQLGGTDGILTQKVAGVRHFQLGESTLLFLRPGEKTNDPMLVVGLMQGNFRMLKTSSGETVASNGVADASVLRGGEISAYSGSQIPLTILESRIKKAVRQ